MERVGGVLEQPEWKDMAQRASPGEDGHQNCPPHHLPLSLQDLACKSKCCLGSIMYSKSLTRGPRDKPTSPDELLPQAIEFVNQYYSSFKE